MDESRETLRRKAALYRHYLAQGVTADLAHIYLEEIASIERTLAQLDRVATAPTSKGTIE
jgi:hypothetical protein